MPKHATIEERIPLDRARNSLTTIWFCGAGASFILIAAQTILGKYQGSVQEVWAWFQPTVFPTSALMLGVIGATALQAGYDKRTVKRFFFRLSRGLSIFYLIVLLLILLLEPFSSLHSMDLFNMANYFLAPLQSLVVGAVTVLFTSQEKSPTTPNL